MRAVVAAPIPRLAPVMRMILLMRFLPAAAAPIVAPTQASVQAQFSTIDAESVTQETRHPAATWFRLRLPRAAVAQLDRLPGFEEVKDRFESHRFGLCDQGLRRTRIFAVDAE